MTMAGGNRLAPPSRKMSTLWRLLYLPLSVVLAGFVYFHVSLLVAPKYYLLNRHVAFGSSHMINIAPEIYRNAVSTMSIALDQKGSQGIHSESQIFPGEANVGSDVGPKRIHNINRIAGDRDRKAVNLTGSVPFLKAFEEDLVVGCGGRFIGYPCSLVVLREVTINRSLAMAKASGGEDIRSVRNQPEDSETYTYKPGFFTLPCNDGEMVKQKFKPQSNPNFVKNWFKVLRFENLTSSRRVASRDECFGLAVQRFEYANLYWTLLDIYNAFLIIAHLGQTPINTHIVLMDAKPWSHMDILWKGFFGRVSRLTQLPKIVTFTKLAWSFPRMHSPMLLQQPLPLHTHFRTKMLRAFGIFEDATTPLERYGKNCSVVGKRSLNILFIWRRDYLAHPRNPAGVISRKIANEEELLNATVDAFPECNIRGVQLDKLSMHEQLEIISNTDVMIGMHGAAFAFTWFLPTGSGAIELFAGNVGNNWHMRHIAESNGVHYAMWKNRNPKNELWHSKSTIIEPMYAILEIRNMINKICSRTPHQKKQNLSHQLSLLVHEEESKSKSTRLTVDKIRRRNASRKKLKKLKLAQDNTRKLNVTT